MKKKFENKIDWITGGGNGLGKAIAVNIFNNNEGLETLHWNEFNNLTISLTNN